MVRLLIIGLRVRDAELSCWMVGVAGRWHPVAESPFLVARRAQPEVGQKLLQRSPRVGRAAEERALTRCLHILLVPTLLP